MHFMSLFMLTKKKKEDLANCHSVPFSKKKKKINKKYSQRKWVFFFLNKKPGVKLRLLFGEKTLTILFLFIKRGSCFYKEKRANRKKHMWLWATNATHLSHFVSFSFVSFGLELFIISID